MTIQVDSLSDNMTGASGPSPFYVPIPKECWASCEGPEVPPDMPSDTPLPPSLGWQETVGEPARCWIRRRIRDMYDLDEDEDAEFGEEEVWDWDVCEGWEARGGTWRDFSDTWMEPSGEVGEVWAEDPLALF
jgi:hypothetical protein